jgi:chromosome segregation ATPase
VQRDGAHLRSTGGDFLSPDKERREFESATPSEFNSSELITLSPWILAGVAKEGPSRAAPSTSVPRQTDTKMAHIEGEVSKLRSQVTGLLNLEESNKDTITQLSVSLSQMKIESASSLEMVTQTMLRPVVKRLDSLEAASNKNHESNAQEVSKLSQSLSALQKLVGDLSAAQSKLADSHVGLTASEKESVLAVRGKLVTVELQVAELVRSTVVFNSIEKRVNEVEKEVGKIRYLEHHIQELYAAIASLEEKLERPPVADPITVPNRGGPVKHEQKEGEEVDLLAAPL